MTKAIHTDAGLEKTLNPLRPLTRNGSLPVHCGFLFNHDQLHQLAHSAPIAFELMTDTKNIHVSLVTTSVAQYNWLRRELICRGLPDRKLLLIQLPRWLRKTARLIDVALPFSRVMTLLVNRTIFRNMDVLVTPEKTSLLLRSYAGAKTLKFVHTRHGAGDRSIGFDKHSGKFDLVLMSGAKIRDRLQKAGLICDGKFAIVGYPKFDICMVRADCPRLFNNNRPTVLYNPHCSPNLSSWFKDGLAVLEVFLQSDKYNLIFAPHVMLFGKRMQVSLKPFRVAPVRQIPERYRHCPHILIDLGSERSTDMTYTEMADFYLGDASSQVYEFLRRPRPCAFIDSHTTHWNQDDNYLHWTCGPVVDGVKNLESQVDAAFASHDTYHDVQRELFAYSMDTNHLTSSTRAAQAIVSFVHRTFPKMH